MRRRRKTTRRNRTKRKSHAPPPDRRADHPALHLARALRSPWSRRRRRGKRGPAVVPRQLIKKLMTVARSQRLPRLQRFSRSAPVGSAAEAMGPTTPRMTLPLLKLRPRRGAEAGRAPRSRGAAQPLSRSRRSRRSGQRDPSEEASRSLLRRSDRREAPGQSRTAAAAHLSLPKSPLRNAEKERPQMRRRSLLPPGSSQRLPNGRQSARKAGPKPRKWRTNLRILVRSVVAKEEARHRLRRRLMHRKKSMTTTIRRSPWAVAHVAAARHLAARWNRRAAAPRRRARSS